MSYRLFNGPEGLNIDSNTGQVIWQVPANIFNKQFQVILQVEDHLGNYDIQAYNLIGDRSPVAPTLDQQNLSVATQGSTYSRNLSASDQNAVDTLIWELEYGPENSSINSSNGTFTWAPTSVTSPGLMTNLNTACIASDGALNNLKLSTRWSSWNSYINQPLVGTLYDSNQDGLLNDNDRKAVIGINTQSHVIALDAINGKEIWRRTDVSADPLYYWFTDQP